MQFFIIFIEWQLLILIFCYLNHKSRLTCRLVCPHWLYFLDNSSRFRNDRHLYLHHCLLGKFENPVSTLMQSSRDYYSIKLGRCSITGNFEDLIPFWEKLAKTVTYLDLTEFKCNVFGNWFVIFEQFKKLKTLKVTLSFRKKMWETMIRYLKEKKYAECKEIDELYITDLSGDALLFDQFLRVMPHIKKLSIMSVSDFKDMPVLLQMSPCIIKNVGPNVILIYYSENRVAEEQYLLELTSLAELQLETLDCGWRVDDYNAIAVNNFLNKQELLKDITLECYGDIPVDIYKNVTKLTVRFDDTITSLSKLAPLKHLKYLDFCISESYRDAEYREILPCFFGHEPIPILTLTHLSVKTGPRKYIYMTRDKPGKSCIECWQTMLESFPNLTFLKFCHHKYLDKVFDLILDQDKTLKELILINFRSMDCLLKKWKPMPELTHLELWQATRISVEGMTNLCHKSPNLRHLRLLGEHLGQPNLILKTICINLLDLEVLEVDFDSPGLTKYDFNFLYFLRDLKVLGLGNHEKAQLSFARQMFLFEHLPKLRVIHDIGSDSHTISRVEFLELVKNDTAYNTLVEEEYMKMSKWKKIMSFIKRK